MYGHRCKLCGAANAACGTPTASIPVDGRVRGRVIGDLVVPDLTSIVGVLNDDERSEFFEMQQAYEGRKLRNKIMGGPRAHTSLAYVRCHDGVTRKMKPDDADAYVKLNPDAEIIDHGTREIPEHDVIVGATKATVGEMFDANGRQIPDVQPMTTRSYLASDRVRADVVTPAIGAGGAEADNPVHGTRGGTRRISRAARMEKKPETEDTNDEGTGGHKDTEEEPK